MTLIHWNFSYNFLKITGNFEDFLVISNSNINDFFIYNIINLSSKMNKLDAKLVGLNTLNEGAPINVNKIETIKLYYFRI